MKRRTLLAAALAATTAMGAAPAVAQNYPTQPIRLVVGFAPGGINDVLARMLAAPLGERLGQQVIVENRPGAGSQIGIASVANARPDGYTLLFGTSDGMTLIPAMMQDVPYDVMEDFAPIGLVRHERGEAITVSPMLPAENLDELVELAREAPGRLRYASTGIRSTPHINGILLEAAIGADMTHVPYDGAGPAVTALLAGEVDVFFLTPTTAAPLHSSGQARTIVQSGDARHHLFEEVPTIAESGLDADVAMDAWSAIFGPAGLDPAVVERLSTELTSVLEDPETVQAFHERGVTVKIMSPDELTGFMVEMETKWAEIIETHNLREE